MRQSRALFQLAKSAAGSTRRRVKKTRLSIEGPIDTSLTGRALLNNPSLNKGTAFSHKERETFGITGLLPVQENTLGMLIIPLIYYFVSANILIFLFFFFK